MYSVEEMQIAREEGIEREMESLYMSAREGLAPETSGRALRHQSSSGGEQRILRNGRVQFTAFTL
jgi:hypothetical protein